MMNGLPRTQTYGTPETVAQPANGARSPTKTAVDVTSEGQIEFQNQEVDTSTLSESRKWLLLLILVLSAAQYLDAASFSAIIIFTD
ncbi:hypothetical protein J007_04724 [Cryptococcus neoformans]|nr:hypothetical protein J007_04724 [Cryptococcus neoformans var. grubii]OXC59720.1 hypothetical protein C358_04840 [Cryptococcus neoformans var. grubii MW-RSA852]